jgi:hydrogenase maturation protease
MTGDHAEILVLGLGNDILGDDAVGLHAARAFRRSGRQGIDVRESSEAGFALLDVMAGYESVIIVDAIHTGTERAGSVLEFQRADFQRLVAHSPHFVGLPELFAIAERLELPFPREVRILAMEIDDPWTLREGLSAEITEALPNLVRQLNQLTDSPGAAIQTTMPDTQYSC